MSYSRWSNSFWYTFWRVQPEGQRETRDSAIFAVCGVMDFSASELRADLDACIERVRVEMQHEGHRMASAAEFAELKGLMQRFLADVDTGTFLEP